MLEKGQLVYIYVPRIVGGVLVRNSSIGVTINHGNLVLLGLQNWGDVATSLAPSVSSDQARAVASDHAAPFGSTFGKAASLELIPVSPGDVTLSYRLAWVIRMKLVDDIGNWEALVDAHSGELLNFEDKNEYAQRQIFGGVYPVSNDQRPPDGIEQAGWPMPYAEHHTTARTPRSPTSGGNIGCITGSISTALQGRFLRITDTCGADQRDAARPATSTSASGPTAAATDCTIPAGHSAGDTKSSRTGFYELNQLIEQAPRLAARQRLAADAAHRQREPEPDLQRLLERRRPCNFFKSRRRLPQHRRDRGDLRPRVGPRAGQQRHQPEHLQPRRGDRRHPRHSLRLDESCVGRGFFINQVCGGYGDPCIGTPATGCTGVRDVDFAQPPLRPAAHDHLDPERLHRRAAPAAPRRAGLPDVRRHALRPRDALRGHDRRRRPSGTSRPATSRAAPFNYDANTALELDDPPLSSSAAQTLTSWYTCARAAAAAARPAATCSSSPRTTTTATSPTARRT